MNLFKKKKVEPEQSYVNQRRMILTSHSKFYIQEAYKTLRTNIRFALHGKGCKKICITSGMASEGKSTTILNLAISFAETGSKVLLIDADMRRPSLARLLIEKASPGLSNVLAGLATVEESVRQNIRPNLDVLFSGEIPPNPLELLSTDRMQDMIQELSKKYDYILLDTPPIGIVSDACEVASMTDGVLFLVRQGETEKDTVARGVKRLEFSNAKLLGFILNGAEKGNNKGYKRNYRYRYGYRYRYKYTSESANFNR